MKVLVLGGTGAMGNHLVHLLADDGNEVTVTSRTQKSTIGAVRYVQGNAHDDHFLRGLLQKKWDVIVDFMVYTTASFRQRVNILLSATSQYVFLSSARVYADSPEPITEESPRLLDTCTDTDYLSTDEYALAKARQENILKDSGYNNWTIIRPYITYGEERLQLGVLEKEQWLFRALHGKTIVFSDDINAKATTLTYGLDVSRGICSVIGNSGALGETFNITANKSLLWRDVLSVYLDVLEKHLGRKPKVLLLRLGNFTKVHPARYQIRCDRLFDRVFDSAKIARFVDATSFVDAKTGLRRCLVAFLQSPQFLAIDWKSEALKDKQTGEKTPLPEIQGAKHKLKYLFYRYL